MNAERLNAYRRTLERRMNGVRVICLAYLLLGGLRRLLGPEGNSFVFSMCMGLMMGGMLVLLFVSFRFRRALQDDTRLLRLYNQEHDERMMLIRAKVGFPITVIFGGILVGAAMIASCYSMMVTVTLLIVAVAQMLVTCGLKFWYMRRM